jgi:hypothetical protein
LGKLLCHVRSIAHHPLTEACRLGICSPGLSSETGLGASRVSAAPGVWVSRTRTVVVLHLKNEVEHHARGVSGRLQKMTRAVLADPYVH